MCPLAADTIHRQPQLHLPYFSNWQQYLVYRYIIPSKRSITFVFTIFYSKNKQQILASLIYDFSSSDLKLQELKLYTNCAVFRSGVFAALITCGGVEENVDMYLT